MSFKTRTITLSLLALLGFSSGCADENIPYNEPKKLSISTSSCLKETGPRIAAYLKGELARADNEAFWDCFDRVITTFTKVVRSKQDPNSYSSESIRQFLEGNFLEGAKISDSLLHEIMALKKVLVAGSIERIKKSEIEKLRLKFKTFRAITLDVRPFMPVMYRVFSEKHYPFTEKELVETVQAMESAARKLGNELGSSGQVYTFQNMENLAREILLIFAAGDTDYNDLIERLRAFLPLVSEFKSIIFGSDKQTITAEEWSNLLGAGASIFGAFLRVNLLVVGDSWQKGVGLRQIHNLGKTVLRILRESLERRQEPFYSYAEVSALAQHLERIRLLPLGIRASTIESILPPLFEKILKPANYSRQPRYPGAIEVAHIDAMEFEIEYWYRAQAHFARQFYGSGFLSEVSVDPAVKEMMRVLETPWALVFDDDGRLVFDWNIQRTNLKSVSQLNWQRMLIRLVVRGYAKDKDRFARLVGVDKDELETFHDDFFDLAVDVGLFNPGSEMWGKIFMEANLLMPRAQGDQILNFEEAIEYVSFVLSGLSAGKKAFSELKGLCEITHSNGSRAIEAPCLRQELFQKFDSLMGHLPFLRRWLFEHNDPQRRQDRWRTYQKLLESTVRNKGSLPDDPLSSAETMEMLVLAQYIETIFGRFDADGSATINVEESLRAFPLFRQTLEDLLGFSSEQDLEAIFTYLLRYGEPPSGIAGALRFINWKLTRSTWDFEASRTRLASILAELNSRR